jgi:hypothetical protein
MASAWSWRLLASSAPKLPVSGILIRSGSSAVNMPAVASNSSRSRPSVATAITISSTLASRPSSRLHSESISV